MRRTLESGLKTRDMAKSIPKSTQAAVIVLDLVNHALARKVRIEATRRGLQIFFQKRSRQLDRRSSDLGRWLNG